MHAARAAAIGHSPRPDAFSILKSPSAKVDSGNTDDAPIANKALDVSDTACIHEKDTPSHINSHSENGKTVVETKPQEDGIETQEHGQDIGAFA